MYMHVYVHVHTCTFGGEFGEHLVYGDEQLLATVVLLRLVDEHDEERMRPAVRHQRVGALLLVWYTHTNAYTQTW